MDERESRVITEKKETQEPKTVMEQKTVEEPKTVMEKKVVEEPKTVMEQRVVEEPKTVMETRTYERLVSASCKELDGWEIVNPQGEKLGTFEDVMLDIRSGNIAYAVINVSSGFLGMGSKLVAVPWDALSIESREFAEDEDISRRMILNVSKDKLGSARSFEKGNWPKQPDRSWLNENLYSQYGYTPWWEEKTMKRGEHYSHDPGQNY